ncbi:MAG TPA: extracellular solute-binding protein [Jiangellales bacterium]|nr:extracellular solute-binding protein [Jiangellales bacterium]
MSSGTSGSGGQRAGAGGGFVAAVVALAVVVAGVWWFVGRGGDENPASGGGGAEAAPTVPEDRTDCVQLVVASSPEKHDVLSTLAEEYNGADRQVGGSCSWVEVTRPSSGAAAAALARGWDEQTDGPRPDVWSPAASGWIEIARLDARNADRPDIFPTEAPSLASSPLVVAMPRPMAEALGWPEAAIGWADLRELATDSAGWASRGHPEWGRFKLGKTNPNFSTSGLNATVGTFFAATGVSSDLTVAQVQDPAVAEYVRALEASVVHYGDTTLTFLDNLLAADREGQGLTYVSAVTVEEKSVLDYNAGNPSADPEATDLEPPRTQLAAIYPAEGTLLSDSPYAVLEADWVDDQKRAVAEDLLTWLLEDEQQQRFAEAGFRTAAGETGPLATTDNGVVPEQPTAVLGTPAADVLAAVRDAWEEYRKPARVLMVLDVSGSMAADVEGTGSSRLELAQAATERALDEFAEQDQIGFWAFSSEQAQGQDPWREVVPMGPRDDVVGPVAEAVRVLVADGGTALYATTKAAHRSVESQADAASINAVVLLTDGVNEHSDNDLEAVLDQLATEGSEAGVRVFTIGYGEDADQETLAAIAEASRARSYNASDAASIDQVMIDVVSNF